MRRFAMLLFLLLTMVILIACASPKPVIVKDQKATSAR